MRKEILDASRLHFKAHIEKHKINVEVLTKNSTSSNKSLESSKTTTPPDSVQPQCEISHNYH